LNYPFAQPGILAEVLVAEGDLVGGRVLPASKTVTALASAKSPRAEEATDG